MDPDIPSMEMKTLGTLIERLAEDTPEGQQGFWYRGHRSATWELLPSVWRAGDAAYEQNISHLFRARAALRMQDEPPDFHDHAAWLSKMQHYGLPTRLLDWSTSPLIACYFALEHLLDDAGARQEDAVIWRLRPHRLNQALTGKGYTPSIRSRACADLMEAAFNPAKSPQPRQVRAILADVSDIRIFVQQGAFTVHGDRTALEALPGAATFRDRFVIPAHCTPGVARSLRAAGLRRGDIYPDLANLALEIRRTPPEAFHLAP